MPVRDAVPQEDEDGDAEEDTVRVPDTDEQPEPVPECVGVSLPELLLLEVIEGLSVPDTV